MNNLEELQKQNQHLRQMLKEALAINKEAQKTKRRERVRVRIQRPTATATATNERTATATNKPTATATNERGATATNKPTATATNERGADATNKPNADATNKPNADATNKPNADATTAKPQKELKAQYVKRGFIMYIKNERRLSANTVKSYKWDIKQVNSYLLKKEKPPLHKADAQDFRDFLNEKAKEFSRATQARILACLRSFFKYCQRNDIRKDNPIDLIDTPKRAQVLHTILTVSEVTDLINSIDKKEAQGYRNIAVLRTLYGCGLRVSELLTIKLKDVFLKENRIKVTGKGNKQRFIPLTKETKKAVKNYIEKERANQFINRDCKEYLFLNRKGTNMTRRAIGLIITKYVTKTGIKKEVTPHTFRHSFATHLLENGANINAIQKIMGHSTIASTEVYLKVQDGFIQEQIKKHHLHG